MLLLVQMIISPVCNANEISLTFIVLMYKIILAWIYMIFLYGFE